ncbi:citrate synthase [Henriciella sp. AS95]|uniref:citrate synthase n=1 Tax=Henriciella sp. AS95 TaxID=3135782 RepID=UPI00317FDC2E
MKWIPRDLAMERLGVKSQTLYAYVSRGAIRSRPDEHDSRISLYSTSDIDSFVERRRTGRNRTEIAKAAIAWGDPVMETAITTVRDGTLVYRGQCAITLAETATLEEAAAILWQTEEYPDISPVLTAVPGAAAKSRLLSSLAAQAATALPGFGRGHETLVLDGARLLDSASHAITRHAANIPFHTRLARFWGVGADAEDLIRRTLVLLADHELNASTFAARIAASTGASLAACALAGCATLTGPLHGEATARALAYLRHAVETRPNTALAALAARGERVPAVGHPLYPDGDPRAAALITWLSPSRPVENAIAGAEDAIGKPANIDMALAALTVELGLPEDAPFMLFASGRMVGWVAHAIEQLTSGKLIRPRAKYVGD